MKSTLTIASLVFALLLVAGCGGGSGPSAKVVTIKVRTPW